MTNNTETDALPNTAEKATFFVTSSDIKSNFVALPDLHKKTDFLNYLCAVLTNNKNLHAFKNPNLISFFASQFTKPNSDLLSQDNLENPEPKTSTDPDFTYYGYNITPFKYKKSLHTFLLESSKDNTLGIKELFKVTEEAINSRDISTRLRGSQLLGIMVHNVTDENLTKNVVRFFTNSIVSGTKDVRQSMKELVPSIVEKRPDLVPAIKRKIYESRPPIFSYGRIKSALAPFLHI